MSPSAPAIFRSVPSLMLSRGPVPLWDKWEGERILFIFPGYRQSVDIWDQWLGLEIPGWKMVLVGMAGAIGEANAEATVWREQDWYELLGQLRAHYQPTEEVWLGYSLGGRILLHVAGLPESGLKTLFLISPDGLDRHWLESNVLYRPMGLWLLRYLVDHPRVARKVADRLRSFGWMSASSHYFALRQLRDEHELKAGFHAARIYSLVKPNRKKLRRADRMRDMFLWASWGDADRVRPVVQSRELWRYFRGVNLAVFPGGHTWPQMDPELFCRWIESGIVADQRTSPSAQHK